MIQISDIKNLSSNRLVPYYLMAGWLYNSRDNIIMTDDAWDHLVKRLAKEWNTVDHIHKKYIDPDSFDTATSQYLTDERVPLMARSAAIQKLGITLPLGTTKYKPYKEESVGLESFFE